MASTKAASKDTDGSETSYPKKYWWLVLIVVPIVIALIQYRPWEGDTSGAGSSSGITVGDVSIIVNEAAQSGNVLSDELVNQLKQAVERSQQGQHQAAVAGIERVRASSGQVAALPSLLVNLADEYRRSGKEDDAQTNVSGRSQAGPDEPTGVRWAQSST